MSQFTVERALLDAEIKHLEFVAQATLTTAGATTLLEKHDIRVSKGSLYPYCAGMERLIKACDKAGDHTHEFTILWPEYVKSYLGTDGWELGYGFVGASKVGNEVQKTA